MALRTPPLPRVRRRRRPLRRATRDPLTLALAAVAAVTAGTVTVTEVARVWRRGSAPMPSEADGLLAAAGEATLQTVEVAVEGLRRSPLRESALLSLLLSFNSAWLIARLSTYTISRRGHFGPFRNAIVGRTHIHHFVPGIVLMLLAGGGSIISRNEEHDPYFAVPFGIGAALTLDESALLLRLDDVYWSEEGILSVQITAATASLVGATALVTRLLRRGEEEVLEVGGSD